MLRAILLLATAGCAVDCPATARSTALPDPVVPFRASCVASLDLSPCVPGQASRIATAIFSFPCAGSDPGMPGQRRWASVWLLGSEATGGAIDYACGESSSVSAVVSCDAADPIALAALDNGDAVVDEEGTCGFDAVGPWQGLHRIGP